MTTKLAPVASLLKIVSASLLSLFWLSSSLSFAQDQMAVAPADQETVKLFPKEVAGFPIENFLQTKSYLKVLQNSVIDFEKRVGACETPVFSGRIDIALPQIARAFPEVGVVPQWLEIIEVAGCEQPFQRYVLVGIVDDAPKFYPLFTGNALSALDMVVENDVLKTLLASEKKHAVAAGCDVQDAIRVHTTTLLSHKQNDDTLAWTEAWHIANCKGQKTLTIEFETNPEMGTRFAIHQPEKSKTTTNTNEDMNASAHKN